MGFNICNQYILLVPILSNIRTNIHFYHLYNKHIYTYSHSHSIFFFLLLFFCILIHIPSSFLFFSLMFDEWSKHSEEEITSQKGNTFLIKFKNFFRFLGPGFVMSIAYVDPGNFSLNWFCSKLVDDLPSLNSSSMIIFRWLSIFKSKIMQILKKGHYSCHFFLIFCIDFADLSCVYHKWYHVHPFSILFFLPAFRLSLTFCFFLTLPLIFTLFSFK